MDRHSHRAVDAVRDCSVRESYQCFPAWTQPIWTRLTGKPLPHERPAKSLQPALAIGLDLAAVVLVSAFQLRLLTSLIPMHAIAGYVLTPVLALYVTGRLRKAQVVYGHHAIHGTLFGKRSKANALAAGALTVFALAQNETEYEQDHMNHHRRTIFTTRQDADALLLYAFGIRPGRSLKRLYWTLLMTLCSPRYHLWFLRARLASNFRRPGLQRAAAIAWMTVIFLVAPERFGALAAGLAIWLPFTLLYQMSALIQFATEHVWMTSAVPDPSPRGYAQRCHGRFCGERVPGTDGSRASAQAWLAWWGRTIFIHVPTRMAVLVGDLPAHDWHHLAATLGHSPRSWPTAIFERQRAIDAGNGAGMDERELWGAAKMVQHVLLSMSRAPALPDENTMRREATTTSGS